MLATPSRTCGSNREFWDFQKSGVLGWGNTFQAFLPRFVNRPIFYNFEGRRAVVGVLCEVQGRDQQQAISEACFAMF